MLSLPGLKALGNHRNQSESYWKSAAEKIRSGIVIPEHLPKFVIHENEKVFAVGSCFARRIEAALFRKNMSCISAESYQENCIRVLGKAANPNYANKYSTHSILNELRWALDPESPFPEDAIVDLLGDGYGYDLQAAPHLAKDLLPSGNCRQIYERHLALLTSSTARVKEVDVLIITLGLVELWFDHKVGLYTNASPLAQLLETDVDRFTFEVTSFNENMANLDEIYLLLRQFCKPAIKVIVTVSPVPMAATFSGRDVTVANTFSKAVLRAVAEEWSLKHENVDYFPSFEMATLSEHKKVWEEDLIQVRDNFADVIIEHFSRTFYEAKQSARANRLPVSTRAKILNFFKTCIQRLRREF